jgi:hypothetical protein
MAHTLELPLRASELFVIRQSFTGCVLSWINHTKAPTWWWCWVLCCITGLDWIVLNEQTSWWRESDQKRASSGTANWLSRAIPNGRIRPDGRYVEYRWTRLRECGSQRGILILVSGMAYSPFIHWGDQFVTTFPTSKVFYYFQKYIKLLCL